MAQPTIKQKLALKELIETLARKEPLELKKIMLSAGYSKATAHNPEKNLLNKGGWKQLLAKIDDKILLDRLYEIAMAEDKRSSMEAIKTILIGLKGYGADVKLKITQYEGELKDLTNRASEV